MCLLHVLSLGLPLGIEKKSESNLCSHAATVDMCVMHKDIPTKFCEEFRAFDETEATEGREALEPAAEAARSACPPGTPRPRRRSESRNRCCGGDRCRRRRDQRRWRRRCRGGWRTEEGDAAREAAGGRTLSPASAPDPKRLPHRRRAATASGVSATRQPCRRRWRGNCCNCRCCLHIPRGIPQHLRCQRPRERRRRRRHGTREHGAAGDCDGGGAGSRGERHATAAQDRSQVESLRPVVLVQQNSEAHLLIDHEATNLRPVQEDVTAEGLEDLLAGNETIAVGVVEGFDPACHPSLGQGLGRCKCQLRTDRVDHWERHRRPYGNCLRNDLGRLALRHGRQTSEGGRCGASEVQVAQGRRRRRHNICAVAAAAKRRPSKQGRGRGRVGQGAQVDEIKIRLLRLCHGRSPRAHGRACPTHSQHGRRSQARSSGGG
mmetsp:Transcript_53099/g.139255  ORF Transcript_53099/g.139255 Transcript_53099/m.139255 type:complete len:434 (+) Transcript_53099:991-2292(+)